MGVRDFATQPAIATASSPRKRGSPFGGKETGIPAFAGMTRGRDQAEVKLDWHMPVVRGPRVRPDGGAVGVAGYEDSKHDRSNTRSRPRT